MAFSAGAGSCGWLRLVGRLVACREYYGICMKIRKGGALDQPTLVRVAGTAFFDGQHRRGGRRGDETDGGHGRCNSSVRALWEIHPVYRMIPP